MQRSLFLLILMGQCSFFTCHLYEYHFVKDKKTWVEAQMCCRDKYTDLATVATMTDMKRLCDSAENEGKAWIGLYSTPGKGNREWHWSLPGVEFINNKTYWHPDEPNDKNKVLENCVRMDEGKWKDVKCSAPSKFICYNESNESNEKFHLIQLEMTWQNAQNYCRANHTDLVSGFSQLQDKELSEWKKKNSYLWIGLFRDTWRWSDGSNVSYRHWDLNLFQDEQENKTCAMTLLHNLGIWSSDDCNITKPFFCYDDKMILIKENKTWKDALYYCRENYHDLVSITNLDEQRWIQEKAKNASSPYVWLGLRYTCTLDFWFWVSDEVVCYKNWASQGRKDECDMSGAMDRESYQWFSLLDNEKFNFICSKF